LKLNKEQEKHSKVKDRLVNGENAQIERDSEEIAKTRKKRETV